MKILQIIPILGCGGAEILLSAFCEELHRQGHEVEIVTLFPHHETYINLPNREFLEQNIKIHVINDTIEFSFLEGVLTDNKDLTKIITDFKPEIIHVHLYLAYIHVLSLKKPKNTKLFFHFHDNISQFKNLSLSTLVNKKELANYYEKMWVLKRMKEWKPQAITISKDTNSYSFKTMRFSRTHFLPNGINLNKFKLKNIDKTIDVVSVGNLVPKKGHELAIKAIALLKMNNPNIKLHILGYGKEKDNLQKLIDDLSLQENVFLMGNVGNVECYLQSAKIYLHTASYEPFGLVLIEAMACGLPVVCTDGKGNRELIQEGENGFMIWERDAKQLADKIQYLLENEEKRLEMGKKAHAFAQQFGMEEYVRKLVGIYSE